MTATFTEHVHSEFPGWKKYAQSDEDAVIEAIFALIGPGNKRCMEFGAADGFFCSNTATLWKDLDWSAILIESDPQLFKKLQAATIGSPKVVTHQGEVENPDDYAPDALDFISIDVDGEDFNIWERSEVPHRVVCIEHNPTFPPGVEFHGGQWMGASASSLIHLGESKGYQFLMATKTNCFFVREDEFDAFEAFDCTLNNNFDTQSLNYVVTDYHGNFDVAGDLPYGMNWKVKLL